MFQATVIGHIGSDAECKNFNGKEFTTFRVAHTDRWTDENGKAHDTTTWVDCVINGVPAVIKYLTKGTQVYVCGNAQLRIYSSPKDKCMKAGITINAKTVELIGAKPDPVPSTLYKQDTGEAVPISKHFFALGLIRQEDQPEYLPLISAGSKQFVCDRNGMVTPFDPAQQ